MMEATSKQEIIDFLENKLHVEWHYSTNTEDTITVETKTPNVEGYNGFVLDFNFDVEGNYVNIGIWE